VRRATAAAPLLAIALAGCGSKTAAPPTVAPPVALGHGCLIAPPSLVAKLQAGIVLENAKLMQVRVFRSPKLRDFYFVSARVPALAADAVATWAAKGIEPSTQIVAVDTNARQISEFGSGLKHNPQLTETTPGAAQSRACVTRSV
jgi:hypothetical protein